MIVITAPTGNIGRLVLAGLLESAPAGEELRVVVRDPARLPEAARGRVAAVTGSHADPGVLDQAFAGADAVFWLVPPDSSKTPHEAWTEFTRPAVKALSAHGVTHVVGVSALGRGTPLAGRAGLVTASLAMDDLIAGSGVAYRARQTRIARDAGAEDPQALACQLALVYDGAAVGARMDRDPQVAQVSRAIAGALVDAAITSPHSSIPE